MKRILVIDDEKGVIDILLEVLKNAGYDVDGQSSSKKALEQIKTGKYDIVITDLKMPEIDGIEIVKASKKINEAIEVIIVTGYASLSSAIDALKNDVFDYIFKPFSVSDILFTVQKVSNRINLREENNRLSLKIEEALSSMTMLNEICKIISKSDEVQEILHFAISAIESSIDPEMVSIMLFDKQLNEFKIEKSAGFTQKTIDNFKITKNEGIIGQAIKTDETTKIDDYNKDKNFTKNVSAGDKKKMSSFISVPLNAQDFFEGIITIHGLDTNVQEDLEKIKLVEVLAVQIAPMIRLGQYSYERKMMLTDSLYGAKNQLFDTIKKAGEYRGSLSILIFKLYLKTKTGFNVQIFEIGDAVYKHVKNNISPIDSALKVGIDSFMVILQGKTKMLTEGLAAKIKKEAEKDKVLSKHGFLLDYGYADFPVDGDTFEELISKAQGNLWKFFKKS